MSQEKRVISVTTGTMIRALLVAVGAWLVYLMRDILGILLVSLLLAALLDPLADWLEKRRIPRSVTVLLTYVLIFVAAGVTVLAIIPPMLVESHSLGDNIRGVWGKAVSSFDALRTISGRYGLESSFQASVDAFNDSLTGWFNGLFSTVTGFLGGIASFFVVLAVSYFLVVEKRSFRDLVTPFVPAGYREYIGSVSVKIQRKIGQWLFGQLLLMIVIAALSYVGLLVFGVKYAVLLAVLAGLLEVVPYVGPVAATIPAVFFALGDSPTKAVLILIYYLLTQRLENMFLVPKVMQKTTGLNPLIAVLALAVGFVLGGVSGVLLSIPVATALGVILSEYIAKQNQSKDL